jgi:hypothetical protein
MRSNYNLALRWMHAVLGLPQTHYMFPDVLKVAILVDKILTERGLKNCIFAEIHSYMEFQNVLSWRFGLPNPELFVFAPNRMYIDKNNPFLELWRDCDIDDKILDVYRSRSNNKYKQPSKKLELPSSYNLFVLQDSIGSEQDHLNDALAYARDTKTYTVFKQHPLTKIDIKQNEYAIFADSSYDLDHLLDNADAVSSSWSSTSLNAMLRGKRTATYDLMPYSEIVPRIDIAYQLENVEPVSDEVLSRFLSWFTHKLCIDVSKEDYESRIEKRIVDFSNGMRTEELLK